MTNVRCYWTSQFKRIMKCMGQDQMSLWYGGFCIPLQWKSGQYRVKIKLHTFVTAAEKNMKHESQGHTTSNRCPRINTYKIKKLVKKNSY